MGPPNGDAKTSYNIVRDGPLIIIAKTYFVSTWSQRGKSTSVYITPSLHEVKITRHVDDGK